MSADNPNFSPLGSLVSGIITMILLISLFISLPYMPTWLEKASFLFIAVLSVFAGFLATYIAIKQGVVGDVSGIIASNIGITLPSIIELGYVFFFKTSFTVFKFITSILAYFFMFVLLVVVVTVSSLLGTRLANYLFQPGLKPIE